MIITIFGRTYKFNNPPFLRVAISRLAVFSVTLQCVAKSEALQFLPKASCSRNHFCRSFTGTFTRTSKDLSPNYISDFLGLIYLTIWLMDLSEPEIQFEII